MNAVMRHRLRNFASGIKSAVELLSQETLGAMPHGSREYFPLILNECNSLYSLTKRLNLFFENTQSGGRGTASSALEHTLADLHQELPSAKIIVAKNAGAFKTVIPDCEAARIALLEIMRNAAEAGGKKEIRLKCALNRSSLRFIVEDQGPGVQEKDLEKIFLPFYTTRSRHVGIGLNIARKLAAKNGGTVKAQNNKSGGLTMALEMPFIRA